MALLGLDEAAHDPRGQIHLAGLQDADVRGVAAELDVGQVLGLQQAAHVALLVLGGRAVLEVVAQILNGVLAGVDLDVRALLEGGREHVHHVVLVALHSKGAEHYDEGDVLAEAGHAHGEGVAEAVKLGAHAHLQLLGGSCKGLVERLHLAGVSELGRGLLVEEDHDAVIGHLLLAQNRALAPVNDEVAEGVVGALADLLLGHGVVLGVTERGAQHDRNLAERDALKHLGVLLKLRERGGLVSAHQEAHVAEHLGRIGEVAGARLLREHGLDAARGLLDARLHIGDVLKREAELVLVLLGLLVLLVPHHDGRGRGDDQGDLVADEIFEGLKVVVHQLGHTAALKVSCDGFPVHGISLMLNRRKSILDSFLIEDMEPIKITKLGAEGPKLLPPPPAPAAGRRKTQRTYPRGILKAVADPARAPPLKKSSSRRTIRLMTEKGIKHRRKTIKRTIRKMSDGKVRDLVQKAGLLKSSEAPVSLMRQMLEGGVMAGLVSL